MSRPEKHILRSIDENATGRPVFAQLIGEEIQHLTRTVADLLRHPVAGIDLNLGCPAPKVSRKTSAAVSSAIRKKSTKIFGALRAATPGLFTVKMRIGFEDTRHFDRVLDLVNHHRVDLLSVHGRTVKEMYRSEVHYNQIAHAVSRVRCPVLANGNVTSSAEATRVVAQTRAAGVMIGRHAIRNPWIFRQCREAFAGQPVTALTLADARDYVERLYRATQRPDLEERYHVNKMKKYLNFVGQSVDADGAFFTPCAAPRPRPNSSPFAINTCLPIPRASSPRALPRRHRPPELRDAQHRRRRLFARDDHCLSRTALSFFRP